MEYELRYNQLPKLPKSALDLQRKCYTFLSYSDSGLLLMSREDVECRTSSGRIGLKLTRYVYETKGES